MALRFRQFEVFRCLMASGTMTRAAAALSISQPAVSRHVAELEAHLGFQLFKRIRGRLEPTAAAVQLARVVEQNFLGLERIEHAAREIREGLPQPVTVACLPALSTSLLPQVAVALRERGLRLLVDSGPVSELIERLRNLDADLALTLSLPAMVGIDAEPLFTVDHVCALPEGHRLCEREVIEPADFRGEPVVGWSAAGPIGFEEEASTLAEHVDSRNVAVTTHTSHTRYAMVAAGLGITIAEPFAALSWLGKGVVLRPFRPRLALAYSLCYPASRVRSESVHEVREAILDVVRHWQDPTGGLITLVPARV